MHLSIILCNSPSIYFVSPKYLQKCNRQTRSLRMLLAPAGTFFRRLLRAVGAERHLGISPRLILARRLRTRDQGPGTRDQGTAFPGNGSVRLGDLRVQFACLCFPHLPSQASTASLSNLTCPGPQLIIISSSTPFYAHFIFIYFFLPYFYLTCAGSK